MAAPTTHRAPLASIPQESYSGSGASARCPKSLAVQRMANTRLGDASLCTTLLRGVTIVPSPPVHSLPANRSLSRAQSAPLMPLPRPPSICKGKCLPAGRLPRELFLSVPAPSFSILFLSFSLCLPLPSLHPPRLLEKFRRVPAKAQTSTSISAIIRACLSSTRSYSGISCLVPQRFVCLHVTSCFSALYA